MSSHDIVASLDIPSVKSESVDTDEDDLSIPTANDAFNSKTDTANNCGALSLTQKRKPIIEKKSTIKRAKRNRKTELSSLEIIEKEARRKTDDTSNEKILQHFSLDCKDCSHSSTTFMNFMTHSMQVHRKRGFVYCCDRKLSKRCKVLEHISLHTDPESFKYECDAPLNSIFYTFIFHPTQMS